VQRRERRRERFRRQVGGRLGARGAAEKEEQHRVLVATVERPERPRPSSRGSQQLFIAHRLDAIHAAFLAR
jgi:hypothetical protein